MLKGKSKYNIAIVGASGAVGSEFRAILEERNFPVDELRIFGSSRSAGNRVSFRGELITVRELLFNEGEFKGIDIVLSSPGKSVSKKFVPLAIRAGAVVVDNTSAFRMDSDVPLVVPEINAGDIKKHKGVIANPNCSAIVMLMAVWPLHRKSRVKRVIVSTYQSASGAGRKAMRELYAQTRDFLHRAEEMSDLDELGRVEKTVQEIQEGKSLEKKAFPHQIAFNLFSHNSAVSENGYNEEELKMIEESRKILHEPKMKICPTCVRVPIFRAHSESMVLEFEKPIAPKRARLILSKAPGVKVVDDREKNRFPMPIEASGGDDILVGRIRKDLSFKNGLALFVVGDQLRKGAALNAIQIAERLIERRF